jgi:hypothetical protein
MSQWEERYKNQPIHNQAKSLVEKLKSMQISSEDLQAVENRQLLLDVTTRAELVLKNTDPLLVTQTLVNQLNNASNQISNITSQVDAYISTPNPSYLVEAISHLEPFLDSLRGLPQQNTENVGDLLEDLSNYRNSFDGLVNDFAQKRDEYTQTFKNHADEFESEVASLKTQMTEIERRTQELRQLAEQQTQRVDSILTTSQGQFLQDQSTRQTNFQSEIKTFTTKFDNLIKETQEKEKTLFEGFTSKANETLEEASAQFKEKVDALDSMKEQARKILDIIGSDSVAGKYGQIASEERKQANFFRWVAFISMLITVGISGWIAFSVHTTQLQTWEIVTRIIFALLSGSLAGYAIAESRGHRKNERKNRKFELELAAIDPYLALFDTEKRNEIKARLAEKIFAQPEPQSGSKEEDSFSSNTLIGLVETVLKNLPKS